ncbi:MAG TPA: hypothetical protein PKD79_03840 [Candidatus Doudnabacteria bacterium]|nr:hypothetical protein [Candidatus Doudnabacteria bacterium]
MDNQANASGAGNAKLLPILVILIVLLIAAGLFLFMNKEQTPVLDSSPDVSQELSVQTTQLGAGETPRGIPANLPMQTGNQVLQNYEALANDGRLQSTKIFSTSLSVAQALQIYTSFFEDLNWVRNTTGTLQSPVLMKNKQDSLMIIVTKESAQEDTIVEISLTQHNQ